MVGCKVLCHEVSLSHPSASDTLTSPLFARPLAFWTCLPLPIDCLSPTSALNQDSSSIYLACCLSPNICCQNRYILSTSERYFKNSIEQLVSRVNTQDSWMEGALTVWESRGWKIMKSEWEESKLTSRITEWEKRSSSQDFSKSFIRCKIHLWRNFLAHLEGHLLLSTHGCVMHSVQF